MSPRRDRQHIVSRGRTTSRHRGAWPELPLAAEGRDQAGIQAPARQRTAPRAAPHALLLAASIFLVLLAPAVLAETPPASPPAPAPAPAAEASPTPAPAPAAEASLAPEESAPASSPEPELTPPSLVEESRAAYPPELVEERISGTVRLELVIGVDGTVEEVKVLDGIRPELEAAAVTAAGRLRFEPARLGGEPIPVSVAFDYHFVAPEPTPRAWIAGRLRARGSRRPIPGATLEAAGWAEPVETDGQGRFEVELPPGAHAIRVAAHGYHSTEFTEEVADGERLELAYALEPLHASRYETVVRSDEVRREVTRIALEGQEIRDVPGTLGDPFRAVMKLPGVHTPASSLPFPIIRGSQPSDTGFHLDGVRIPVLFHMMVGPSVIHPEFIEGLTFIPGIVPPRYGRLTGGVIDGRISKAREDRLHATADIDILNVGGLVEYPFKSTGTNVTLAGRFSYTPALAAALFSDGDETTQLDFWDVQARVEQRVGPGRLRAFAFGASDMVASRLLTSENELGVEFFRADLRYLLPLGNSELEVGLNGGQDRFRYRALDLQTSNDDMLYALQKTASARAIWTAPLPDGFRLQVGADAEYRTSRVDGHASRPPLDGPGFEADYSSYDRAILAGGFGELSLILEDWTLMLGGRLDVYNLLPDVQHWSLEPRVTVLRKVAEGLHLKGGAALVRQAPAPLFGLPGLGLGGLRFGLQEVLNLEVGTEWRPFPGFEVAANIYYSPVLRGLDLSPFLDEATDPGADQFLAALGTAGSGDPTRGVSYGVELFLRHRMGENWFGWLSYTWARSERMARYRLFDAQGNPDGIGQGIIPTMGDRTHSIQLTVNHQLPKHWNVGASVSYATGTPESGILTSKTHVEGTGADGNPTWIPLDRSQAARLPASFRVDLRVAKTWIFDAFTLETSFDVTNATLTPEVMSYAYLVHDPGPSAVLEREEEGIPLFIPLLGLKVTY